MLGNLGLMVGSQKVSILFYESPYARLKHYELVAHTKKICLIIRTLFKGQSPNQWLVPNK